MVTINPEQLAREGWVRRAVTDGARLEEQVTLYRELGHEVLLVPVLELCAAEGGDESCTSCFEGDADPSRFQIIFTREAGQGQKGG